MTFITIFSSVVTSTFSASRGTWFAFIFIMMKFLTVVTLFNVILVIHTTAVHTNIDPVTHMLCARSRPLDEQILGSSFFMKEHTKPLFHKNRILTVQNLYTYHTFMEVYKILKYQSPISMYSQYLISNRKYLTHNLNLITPPIAGDFMKWNEMKYNSYTPPIWDRADAHNTHRNGGTALSMSERLIIIIHT